MRERPEPRSGASGGERDRTSRGGRCAGRGRNYAGVDGREPPRRAPPGAARGSQRAPARGRHARRGAAADPRRRRQRQDPRAHAPHRLPDPHRQAQAERDPGDHVHQQGRAGDARARRAPARAAHARDVGDDLPRRLRADPARRTATRLGYTRQFTIYDQADARRLVKHCIDGVGRRPQALHPRGRPQPDLRRQEPAARRRRLPRAGRLATSSRPSPTSTSSTSASCVRSNAMDFDDLLFRTVNLLELFPEVRERYGRAFRHVLVDEYQDTNHAQYRLLQLLVSGAPGAAHAEHDGARADRAGRPRLHRAGRPPQPRGRRRRRAVHLRLPRRGHPQHPRLRGRLPRRARRQARAELPLHRRRSSPPPTP